MATLVNLDALIPREDFEVEDQSSQAQLVHTIPIRDLEIGSFFYAVLRKPDFQRETADWTGVKICEFVQSFLDGDLIPAIILWNSGSYNFVIDGAHRLSALIAWVNDDYGDRAISRNFFEGRIPDEQNQAAEETRRLIKKKIGSYEEHRFAISNPGKASPELFASAKRLGSLALQLQWVKGDATKAEASFFKINQHAAPIDQTELKLLKSRRSPNALAARAIIRSGTGHKYWSKFEVENQQTIEETSKQINEVLFQPKLVTPIKTLDLPIAGRGYSAQTLPLIFDLVNIVNDVRLDKGKILPADTDGSETIRYLKNTRKVVQRISGQHPSSLGLHPAVYFYSAAGRYQPTAFLSIVSLFRDFEQRDQFAAFTSVRRRFEDFLLRHKNFSNQATLKFGSGLKGFSQLKALFRAVVKHLQAGLSDDKVVEALLSEDEFSYLQPLEKDVPKARANMDTETKSAAFLRDALKSPLRCQICEGLIHVNAISVDHVRRKQDGGFGHVANAQLTHPYCNTTIKN